MMLRYLVGWSWRGTTSGVPGSSKMYQWRSDGYRAVVVPARYSKLEQSDVRYLRFPDGPARFARPTDFKPNKQVNKPVLFLGTYLTEEVHSKCMPTALGQAGSSKIPGCRGLLPGREFPARCSQGHECR